MSTASGPASAVNEGDSLGVDMSLFQTLVSAVSEKGCWIIARASSSTSGLREYAVDPERPRRTCHFMRGPDNELGVSAAGNPSQSPVDEGLPGARSSGDYRLWSRGAYIHTRHVCVCMWILLSMLEL